MPVHRIAHYNIRLSRELMADLARFYVDVVGLAVGPRPAFPSHGMWLYAGGQDVLHLSEQREGDPRRAGSDLTFDHVALECSGWADHEARLKAAGIPYRLDHVPGTPARQVFFRDPMGNGIELIFRDAAA